MTNAMLGEASLARLYSHWGTLGFTIVSAFRGEHGKPANMAAHARLKRAVRAAGYGFIPLVGYWIETNVTTGQRQRQEELSLLVPTRQSQDEGRLVEFKTPTDVLRDHALAWGRISSPVQESIILVEPGGPVRFLDPATGQEQFKLSKFRPGRVGDIYSKLSGRSGTFVFEGWTWTASPRSMVEASRRKHDGEIEFYTESRTNVMPRGVPLGESIAMAESDREMQRLQRAADAGDRNAALKLLRAKDRAGQLAPRDRRDIVVDQVTQVLRGARTTASSGWREMSGTYGSPARDVRVRHQPDVTWVAVAVEAGPHSIWVRAILEGAGWVIHTSYDELAPTVLGAHHRELDPTRYTIGEPAKFLDALIAKGEELVGRIHAIRDAWEAIRKRQGGRRHSSTSWTTDQDQEDYGTFYKGRLTGNQRSHRDTFDIQRWGYGRVNPVDEPRFFARVVADYHRWPEVLLSTQPFGFPTTAFKYTSAADLVRRLDRAVPLGEARKIRISTKDPDAMSAGQIEKERKVLDPLRRALGDTLIAAGRGHEKHSETSAAAERGDPLAVEYMAVSDRIAALSFEISRRMKYSGTTKRIKRKQY